MLIYILIGLCCFFSFLNLIAVLFMSNALFRFVVSFKSNEEEQPSVSVARTPEGGLVDLKAVPTYDPRFRS
jgi:hypothetical protein